jgi:hypothetical protein
MEYDKMNFSPQWLRILTILGVACCAAIVTDRVHAQSSACDLNQSGGTNIADVQLSVNMVLGTTPCTATIVSPGTCDIVVVQRVVNAALGGPCVTNTPPASHSVMLSWNGSSSSGVSGYNVYRATTSGGPFAKVNSSLVATINYNDLTVQNGVTYFYVVTAVGTTNLESGFSNVATAVIPAS